MARYIDDVVARLCVRPPGRITALRAAQHLQPEFYHACIRSGTERTTHTRSGLDNGFLVTVERFFRRRWDGQSNSKWVTFALTIVGLVYVQLMFSLGMVLFNGHSLEKSIVMYGRIFSMADGEHWAHDEYLVYIVIITYLFNAAQRFARWEWVDVPWKRYAATGIGGLLIMLLMGAFPPGTSDFIYFQF